MPGIRAGELDRQIVIETPTVTLNDINEPVTSWSTFATVWAAVSPMYASERFKADEIHSIRALRFVIRPLTNLDEKMRISYDGNYYRITGIAEIGRSVGLQITAEADLV